MPPDVATRCPTPLPPSPRSPPPPLPPLRFRFRLRPPPAAPPEHDPPSAPAQAPTMSHSPDAAPSPPSSAPSTSASSRGPSPAASTASSPRRAARGDVVGAYELDGSLGRGNFGRVVRARHVATGRPYAVKVVQTSMLKQGLPDNLDIRREMSILRALSHPNIVALHEVMVGRGAVYMVMDLASGGDFYHLIRRHGRLPEPVARRFFRQLVAAVSYCHRRGVFHRDLKPENLLLGADGLLKVSDFGFSAMRDHGDGRLRANCGSPHYCAPEVWNGSCGRAGYDGAKADAFSCGVILYVLLSGGQPFYDDDDERLLQKVDRCHVRYPRSIPRDAVDLLSRLIVRDPATRWDLDMVRAHPWFTGACAQPASRCSSSAASSRCTRASASAASSASAAAADALLDADDLDALASDGDDGAPGLGDGDDELYDEDALAVPELCDRCNTCCTRSRSLADIDIVSPRTSRLTAT